jgi:hypothetical protein
MIPCSPLKTLLRAHLYDAPVAFNRVRSRVSWGTGFITLVMILKYLSDSKNFAYGFHPDLRPDERIIGKWPGSTRRPFYRVPKSLSNRIEQSCCRLRPGLQLEQDAAGSPGTNSKESFVSLSVLVVGNGKSYHVSVTEAERLEHDGIAVWQKRGRSCALRGLWCHEF